MPKMMTQEEWEARMRLKGLDPDEILNDLPRKTVTVQQTSKKWKGLMAAGILMLMVGLGAILSVDTAPGQDEGLAFIGVLLVIIGLVTSVFAKVMSWWHHA